MCFVYNSTFQLFFLLKKNCSSKRQYSRFYSSCHNGRRLPQQNWSPSQVIISHFGWELEHETPKITERWTFRLIARLVVVFLVVFAKVSPTALYFGRVLGSFARNVLAVAVLDDATPLNESREGWQLPRGCTIEEQNKQDWSKWPNWKYYDNIDRYVRHYGKNAVTCQSSIPSTTLRALVCAREGQIAR